MQKKSIEIIDEAAEDFDEMCSFYNCDEQKLIEIGLVLAKQYMKSKLNNAKFIIEEENGDQKILIVKPWVND